MKKYESVPQGLSDTRSVMISCVKCGNDVGVEGTNRHRYGRLRENDTGLGMAVSKQRRRLNDNMSIEQVEDDVMMTLAITITYFSWIH